MTYVCLSVVLLTNHTKHNSHTNFRFMFFHETFARSLESSTFPSEKSNGTTNCTGFYGLKVKGSVIMCEAERNRIIKFIHV